MTRAPLLPALSVVKHHSQVLTFASQPQSERTKRCIQAIKASGKKITPSQTVRAWKVPATSEVPMPQGRPEHMWVETGNSRAGLEHIQCDKAKIGAFNGAGIPPSQQWQKLPVLAEAHTIVGRHVGYQTNKKQGQRPVFATYIEGKVQKMAVTVANNGFIVGMNPRTEEFKRTANEPGEVSERTMKNLYHYPPNRPERRATGVKRQAPAGEKPKPTPNPFKRESTM